MLYVATGDGEAYPEGYLHALDAATLAETRAPIEVGRNVSDMLAFGADLLIASRGDGTLALVDPVQWQELDRIQLGFAPIALATLPTGEAVVGGLNSTQLVVVGTQAGKLVLHSRSNTPGVTNALVATADGSALYVASPNVGIISYDPSTMKRQAVIGIPNNDLAKSIIVWNDYVVSVGQNGYVYFVSRTSNALTTVDVAPDLGLSRANLAARAIDCTQVMDLGGGRLAVITDRQQSLVYQVDPSGPSTTLIGLMPGGAFGTFDAARGDLFLTVPLANALITVPSVATAAPSRDFSARRTTLGVGVAGAQILGGTAPAVAALDSLGAIHILGTNGAQDRLLQGPPGSAWTVPFVASPDGTLMGIIEVRSKTTPAVALLDRNGQNVAEYPVALPSVFNLAFGDAELALVSRLQHQIQFIDTTTGQSDSIVLRHGRPRLLAYMGGGDWLVFHDTAPDIGITRVHNHAEAGFTPLGDWVVHSLMLAENRLLAAAFDGTLSIVSPGAGVSGVRRDAALHGLTDLEYGSGSHVWVTSSDAGAAYEVDEASLAADASYSAYGLMAVGALQGSGSYGIATTRTLEVATRN